MIQLQRDAQIEVAAERVVLRDEGRRRRAAGNGLHDGCLHFHVATSVEERANLAHDGAALEEHVLHLGIADEVEVTLAVTNLGVLDPVPLGRRRAQGLGEDGERFELEARLVGLRAEHRPGHADEIAKVEVLKDVELLVAQRLLLRIDLHAPGLVAHVDEDGLAHVTMRGDATGDREARALGHFALVELRAGIVAGAVRGELVLEGVDALAAQGGELGLALFDERIGVVHKGVRQRGCRGGDETRRRHGLHGKSAAGPGDGT